MPPLRNQKRGKESDDDSYESSSGRSVGVRRRGRPRRQAADHVSATDTESGAFKVKRPSVRYKELKKAQKEKAKRGKSSKEDLSDSPTGNSSATRTVTLPPKKAVTYKTFKERGTRRLERTIDRSVTRMAHGYPPRKAADFKALIPQPLFDEYWTTDDQKDLEERANNDQAFEKRCNIDQFVIGVWKTVYRFCGQLATDIVGPKTHLEFRSGSVLGKHSKWTSTFCDLLTTILVHPLFHLNTDKIALAIQWAVICRTDDRRVYRLSGCEDDMFLLELVSVIQQEQDGSRSCKELRELALSRYRTKFPKGVKSPDWSQLMGIIERRAYEGRGEDGNVTSSGGDSWMLFPNVADLNVVLSALDGMRHGRIRMYTDANTVAESFKLVRNIYDPPDHKLTVEAIKAVFLQVRRNRIRLQRGGPLEGTTAETGAVDPENFGEEAAQDPSSELDVNVEDEHVVVDQRESSKEIAQEYESDFDADNEDEDIEDSIFAGEEMAPFAAEPSPQECNRNSDPGDRLSGDNEESRAVLGKRTRDESQDASSEMVRAIKRINVNVSGPAVSTRLTNEEVDVGRDAFGEIMAVDAKNPHGPSNFSMPSLTESGATDVILKANQREGWDSLTDVTRTYVERGHDRFKMTIKPLVSQPEPLRMSVYGQKRIAKNAVVPYGEERRVEELDDDAPSDSVYCEACEGSAHETRNCPIPTNAGDTVADPFCNQSVRAQRKGDKISHHSLDGRKDRSPGHTELLYCPVLIEFERDEVGGVLVRLFNTLVVDRRRMPPIRVFKEKYCMIRITIEIADRYCQGAMPNAMGGVWPYTKHDALQYRDQLKQFDLLGWEGMPEGQLEGMEFQVIKRQYREGVIPKQIFVRRDMHLAPQG